MLQPRKDSQHTQYSGKYSQNAELGFVDLKSYSSQFTHANNAGCQRFEILRKFPSRSGRTPKTTTHMEKVDIFLFSEVEHIVGHNLDAVERILECSCPTCSSIMKVLQRQQHSVAGQQQQSDAEQQQRSIDEIVAKMGSDVQGQEGEALENTQSSSAGTKHTERKKSTTASTSGIFAMLCYLGLPLLIHLKFWDTVPLYPQGLSLDHLKVCFAVEQPQAESLFQQLFEQIFYLTPDGRLNPSDPINSALQSFFEAFKQAEAQFHPICISQYMLPNTPEDVWTELPQEMYDPPSIPGNAVLPYHEYDFRKSGGQAQIFAVKVHKELLNLKDPLMPTDSTVSIVSWFLSSL